MYRSITLTFTFKDHERPEDDFKVTKQALIDFLKSELAVLDWEDLKIE